MPPRLPLAILAPLAMFAAMFAQGETLDRIAVTVGGHVISERDILQDLRLSAFIDGRSPDGSGEQKRKAAGRLIDQYLVLEDAALTRAPLPPAAEVVPMLAPIKARYASDQEYRTALGQAHITEAELSEHLLAGLRMLRYTDLRFRPEVQLSEESLRAFYDTLAAKGDRNPPAAGQSFEASRNDIEKLLTDQQAMQALDRWLDMTRSETPILYREAVFK
jgi:hypothetical protein